MADIRRRFRQNCDARSKALETACDSRDVGAIRELAHVIAGSAGMFGLTALSEEAVKLSEKCRSANEDEIFDAGRAFAGLLIIVGSEED